MNKLSTRVQIDVEKIPGASGKNIKSASFIGLDGKKTTIGAGIKSLNVEIAPYGLKVIEVLY
ncbi:hypothetical protein D3C87_2131450 [compost metagenome]